MSPRAARSGLDAALFPLPTAPPGKQRQALDRTIRSWARRKHLTGAENAATLEFLRGLADQLDAGWTPQTARTYREALADAAPAPAPQADPRDVALEAAALAIIAALPDDPEEERY